MQSHFQGGAATEYITPGSSDRGTKKERENFEDGKTDTYGVSCAGKEYAVKTLYVTSHAKEKEIA